MVAKQKVWLGRQWARMTVTIHVSETTLAIELPDGDNKVVRRTTDQAVRNITSMRPRTAKHDLGAVRTNEDASDRPPVPRMYDDGVGRDGLEPAHAPRFGCRSRCPM